MNVFLCSVAAQSVGKLLGYLPRAPRKPRVAWIPDAAGPRYRQDLDDDLRRYLELGFEVSHIWLRDKTEFEVNAALEKCDLIHVGGGNSFRLLREMRRSGFDHLLLKHLQLGKPYVGSSAGSVVAGPDIAPFIAMDQPPEGIEHESTLGLGLVDFLPVPHIGCSNSDLARAAEKILAESARLPWPVQGIRDDQIACVLEGNRRIL